MPMYAARAFREKTVEYPMGNDPWVDPWPDDPCYKSHVGGLRCLSIDWMSKKDLHDNPEYRCAIFRRKGVILPECVLPHTPKQTPQTSKLQTSTKETSKTDDRIIAIPSDHGKQFLWTAHQEVPLFKKPLQKYKHKKKPYDRLTK